MRRALFVAALLVPALAGAYESYCYQYGDTTLPAADYVSVSAPLCAPFAGPNTARHRWVGPLDEHRQLFETTRAMAGLPAAISDTVSWEVFTGPEDIELNGAAVPSLIPAALPTRVQRRSLSIGELAQLPDFSYALWDWASGHETCPVGDPSVGATACHDFASHMGPVNANHFLPLAQHFYARYHGLALQRASACRALSQRLTDAAVWERFAGFVRACELEALMLEAVGQHYLQDAFSTGHMWQRWGSAELADFEGSDDLSRRERAVLVALAAGLIHGSRGVLQRLPEWTGYDVNDALTAPHPEVEYVRADGARVRGLGDDYLHQLGEFPEHAQRLYSCAAVGLREVYLAAGAHHGAPTLPDPELQPVDPLGPDCFGQRVTNRALLKGSAIQMKLFGHQLEIPLDSRHVGWLVPKVAQGSAQVPVAAAIKDEFRYGLMRQVALIRLRAAEDPHGTSLAEGELGPLMGAAPNGAYVKTPLASYDEPSLPWPATPDTEAAASTRAEYLARTFHHAHAEDLCRETTLGQLEALRAHAQTQTGETRTAACAACAEFAGRHLEGGFCSAATGGTAASIAAADANAWCGCP